MRLPDPTAGREMKKPIGQPALQLRGPVGAVIKKGKPAWGSGDMGASVVLPSSWRRDILCSLDLMSSAIKEEPRWDALVFFFN